MDTINWTRELDEMIREAVARYGTNDWSKVCQKLRTQNVTPELCQTRWETVLRDQTVKGPWSEEEDAILRKLVEKFGPKKWSMIASYINGRIGKQCRERWLNHLSPNVSKNSWTEEEDEILISAQSQMGNKWSYISKLLPGRSENAVKNRYNSIASRNGVRKKRLVTFVKSQPNRALLKIPMNLKKEESARPTRSNTSYDAVMKKAEEHLPTQTQRLSLQLPTPSEMQQSISYHLSPMKQPPASAFMFDEPHSMEPSDRFAALFPFSDRIDTSELTLTNPVSLQQEQIYLNQMDTQLISGNTIMHEPGSSMDLPQPPPLPFRGYSTPMEPEVFEPEEVDPLGESSLIPPVHFRDSLRRSSQSRGMDRSWDPDGLNTSTNSITMHTGLRSFPSGHDSMDFTRSGRYESLDILRILNESEQEHFPFPFPDNTFTNDSMEQEDSFLS